MPNARAKWQRSTVSSTASSSPASARAPTTRSTIPPRKLSTRSPLSQEPDRQPAQLLERLHEHGAGPGQWRVGPPRRTSRSYASRAKDARSPSRTRRKAPPGVWSGAHCPQSPGMPGLPSPTPHRFIRNINATFSEQIFDVSVAEGKPGIQPESVLNDHGWKSESGIGDILYLATLLRQQHQVTLLARQPCRQS